jgi:hypothetical protein
MLRRVRELFSREFRELARHDGKIMVLNAHWLKIQGSRYLMFLAKIPRGSQGFQEKLPVGPPSFGFYCIFINKCFEICLRGVLYLPSTLPPPPLPLSMAATNVKFVTVLCLGSHGSAMFILNTISKNIFFQYFSASIFLLILSFIA